MLIYKIYMVIPFDNSLNENKYWILIISYMDQSILDDIRILYITLIIKK